jgi:hypothetical protein
MKGILIMGILMALSGCAGHNITNYADQKPPLDLKEYFNGPIKAWGIVQDRSGKVIQRFDVVMVGTWEGDVGTLKENFVYYDGKKQERIWTITKISDSLYEGTAHDILGKAQGNLSGNAMRWAYQMDLPVNGTTYRITFDDWMFNMNDGVLINRSYLKKFGITMAELTLFMQKQ